MHAHWGYVVFTVINFLMTVIGLALVDRKGRKFLFVLGTSGIIVSLLFVAALFLQTEGQRHDVGGTLQQMVTTGSRTIAAVRPNRGAATDCGQPPHQQ